MRIAFLSPEVSPFAKSGEMADVAGSLPKALAESGLDVDVFMPRYRSPGIESLSAERLKPDLLVPLGNRRIKTRIYRSEMGKFDLYLIDQPSFFWREGIYGTGKGEYLDNDERFAFFNRAVLEYLVEADVPIDILHCNNWATALAPVFLRTHYRRHRIFKKTAAVLTLHNIAFQGKFPPDAVEHTGLSWRYLSSKQLSLGGRFNFLKSGLVYADVISTVSSSYRRAIMTRRHGFGLDGVLRKRKAVLTAVRNGIDYEVWNPESDPYLKVNYSSDDFETKRLCRSDILEEAGLKIDPKAPLVGIWSYLSEQKGLDIVLEALDELLALGLGILIQGSGDAGIERRLQEAEKRHKRRLAVRLNQNPALTHKLLGGADIILIPSRFEPCGLNQLYGFRYGTVPVVRATGGLKETVVPHRDPSRAGNGFIFRDYTAAALTASMRQAAEAFSKPRVWRNLMRNGFAADFSWGRAARKYHRLYQRAVALRIKTGASGRDSDLNL